jgi:hypothetical protein
MDRNSLKKIARYLFINLAASLILANAQPTMAETQQKSFASAEQASQALYDAVQSKDDSAVQAILGGVTSGDSERENLERKHFAEKYQQMHRLVREPDGSTQLYIGAENWPFPIPLVGTDGKWRFDSDSGSQEIAAREVGENESLVIEVCQVINRQANGAGHMSRNDVVEFAEKIAKSDNLSNRNELFHGYYFQTSTGRRGGKLVVAYPAEYGASGVMTFIVRKNVVYEKDLGPQTVTIAQKIQQMPAGKWAVVQ